MTEPTFDERNQHLSPSMEVAAHYGLSGPRDTYLYCWFCGKPFETTTLEEHLVQVHNAAESWAYDAVRMVIS